MAAGEAVAARRDDGYMLGMGLSKLYVYDQ